MDTQNDMQNTLMNHVNAGFKVRALASFNDAAINLLILLMFMVLFTVLHPVSDDFVAGGSIVSYLVSFFFFFALGTLAQLLNFYIQLQLTVKKGGSLGKLVTGLRIRNQNTNEFLDLKTALYRVLCGYTFSSVFLFLGYLSVLKNPQKLAWHDRLFSTKVTKDRSSLLGILAGVALLVAVSVSISILAMYVTPLLKSFIMLTQSIGPIE